MFSVLTSKIFAGTSVALALALVGVVVAKNHEIARWERDFDHVSGLYNTAKGNLVIARANTVTVEGALAQCNASIDSAAAQAAQVAEAGRRAVADVRRAGERELNAALARRAAMPTDGATLAQQCQQASDLIMGEAQ